jgi:lipoprotein-anchoring transpeptidase ErfK/SrfK
MANTKIIVNLAEQRLYLTKNAKTIKSYAISSSKYGIGTQPGSNKTPTGLHKIAKMFGKNAPVGTVFKSRANTGKTATIYTDKRISKEDYITTRIMWLRGLEKHNKNSFLRYIYIHGTPDEGLIGTPSSHGCIRMNNTDVIDLFNRVKVGVVVDIIKQ